MIDGILNDANKLVGGCVLQLETFDLKQFIFLPKAGLWPCHPSPPTAHSSLSLPPPHQKAPLPKPKDFIAIRQHPCLTKWALTKPSKLDKHHR